MENCNLPTSHHPAYHTPKLAHITLQINTINLYYVFGSMGEGIVAVGGRPFQPSVVFICTIFFNPSIMSRLISNLKFDELLPKDAYRQTPTYGTSIEAESSKLCLVFNQNKPKVVA